MDLRKDWKDILSGLGTAITTFWAIQEIAKNYGVTLALPANYLSLLAFVGLTAFPLWLGYQIHAWQISKRLKVKALDMETEQSTAESAAKGQVPQGLSLCREKDVPRIESVLSEARRKSTVWVMGLDCTYWLDTCPRKVKDYVNNHDLSFIFLIAKKDSKNVQSASAAGLISANPEEGMGRAIKDFRKIKEDLREKGNKIQLGIYDLPLVHSMVVVNPDTDAETIQVTHYLYKADWEDVPNLSLGRQSLAQELQDVFDSYHNSIKYALKIARDLDGKPLVV